MRSQFEGLGEIRAAHQRKLEDAKEIKRYERALSTNQGRIKTVRRMILNHPTWLNKLLFHNGQWNALHVATSEGQLQKVLWLMQQKDIDINAPDKHNFRPIELAMARNSDTTIVKSLLRAGASIDNINIRSVRPEFKKLIEAEIIKRKPYKLSVKAQNTITLSPKTRVDIDRLMAESSPQQAVGLSPQKKKKFKRGLVRRAQVFNDAFQSFMDISKAMKKQAGRHSPRLGHLPNLAKIRAMSPKNIKKKRSPKNIKKKSKHTRAHSLSPLRKAPAPASVTDTELKKKLRRISPRLLQQEFVENKTQIYENDCSDAVDISGLRNVLIGVGAGVVAHDEIKALFYEIDDANRGYITWRQLSDCLYPHMRKSNPRSLPHIEPPPPRRTGGVLPSPEHKGGGKKDKGKSTNEHQDLCVGGRNSNFASRVKPMPFVDECAEGRAGVSKAREESRRRWMKTNAEAHRRSLAGKKARGKSLRDAASSTVIWQKSSENVLV